MSCGTNPLQTTGQAFPGPWQLLLLFYNGLTACYLAYGTSPRVHCRSTSRSRSNSCLHPGIVTSDRHAKLFILCRPSDIIAATPAQFDECASLQLLSSSAVCFEKKSVELSRRTPNFQFSNSHDIARTRSPKITDIGGFKSRAATAPSLRPRDSLKLHRNAVARGEEHSDCEDEETQEYNEKQEEDRTSSYDDPIHSLQQPQRFEWLQLECVLLRIEYDNQ
ncbi:hypothetical protein BV898_15849 [Hypsibius exemplaris]|uniref:Uncharacterized protein n=1 Tax=Hypsibius exemplaris TaxID=2072580 RepID=A0A9X6RKL7_HYPEX|nr:hypothetical protein BV898_15849 [Hypsibius exemplaris]